MAAANYPIVIEAGATFSLTVLVKTGPAEDDDPMDLAGWSPRLQVRAQPDDLGVLLDCRVANGRISVTDAAAGKIGIVVAAADTGRLDFAAAVYDLIITSGTGEVRRVLEGAVTVSPAVTR